MILDGREIAQTWREKVRESVAKLSEQGIVPGLAVVLVGEDPSSVLYTDMKEKASQKLGIQSQLIRLPEGASTQEVISALSDLNQDAAIHGILVQLPLPEQIDTPAVLESIDPTKDVDGLHPLNLGKLMTGDEAIIPATPKGIMRLIEEYKIETEGKHVVIVGRSNILGKPLAALFLNRDATVTICHSKTADLASFTRMADIVVMDTGVAGLLKGDMIKDGAVVIDAGITKTETGSVVGDADFETVSKKASAITPVPGGVGPMTIAALMDNVLKLSKPNK